MNDKISFPDLVTLLSAKLDVTKKDAEAFLKEFFLLATEVIATGEELRIDGLGEFKPIWMEARASVNVQTGEPVEIPGHYRLSFIPDKVLRDAVNAPFSFFTVEVLNDNVSLEDMLPPEEEPAVGEAAEELSEEVAPIVEEVEREQPEVEETIIEELEPEHPEVEEEDSEMVESEQESEEIQEEEELPEEEPEEEQAEEEVDNEEDEVDEIEDSDDSVNDNECDTDGSRRKIFCREFWWGALSATGIFVLLLLAGSLFIGLCDKPCEWQLGKYTLSVNQEVVVEPDAQPVPDTAVAVVPIDTLPIVVADTLRVDTLVATPLPVAPATTSTQVVEPESQSKPKPEVKTVKETIRPGVFLTTLSLRHYGHKAFWVYIYEENKSIIKNPDQIPIGTEVVIPEASKYGINAKDSASIERAKALQRKIKGK